MHRMMDDDTGGKRTTTAKARDGSIRRFPTPSRAFKNGFGDTVFAHHHPSPNNRQVKRKSKGMMFLCASQFWGKKSKRTYLIKSSMYARWLNSNRKYAVVLLIKRDAKHAELVFSGCRTRLRRDKSVSAFLVALALDRSGTRRLSGTIDSPRFLGLRSDGSDQTRGRV